MSKENCEKKKFGASYRSMQHLRTISYWLILGTLFLLPFHALLVTWMSMLAGSTADSVPVTAKLFASWKEGVLVVLMGIAAIRWWKDSEWKFQVHWTDATILSLPILGFLLQGIHHVGWGQWLLGMITDFRFFAFYLVVRTLKWDTVWIKRMLWTIGISTGFAIIWGFILRFAPADLLLHFGYSPYISSYMPNKPLPIYHIVEGSNEIRLASTLAGPNQLGSFLLIPFALLLAAFRYCRRFWLVGNKDLCSLPFLGLIAISIPLFWTYSRSAWLGAAVIIALYLFSILPNLKTRLITIGIGGIVTIAAFGAILFTHPAFIADNLLRAGSTSEHAQLSIEGAKFVATHPLGIGLGAAGPVSQRYAVWPDKGFISENWYLQIFEELGWLGGIIFLILFCGIVWELWKRKADSIALGASLSLIGIGIAALFLHTWADASTAIVAWGVAGVAMARRKG